MPAHFDAEVLSGIRRALFLRALDGRQARQAVEDATLLRAERVALTGLLSEAFELRDRFSAFDALYVVLARRSSAVLVTADRRPARGARAYVDVVFVDGFRPTQK